MNNSENISFGKTSDRNENVAYHFHMHYEIICVEKGCLTLSTAHKEYAIMPGELCIIPPITAHKTFYENACVTYITFNRDYLYRYISKNALEFMKTHESDILFITEPGNARELTEKIVITQGKGSYIYILMMLKSAHASKDNCRNTGKTGSAVIDFMEQNAISGFSLENASKTLSLTRFYICRLIKSLLGITPVEYITFLKIRQAVLLLGTTTYTITEISEKLSFSSPKYFANVFKGYFGISPTDFRKTSDKMFEKRIFLKR